MLISPRLPCVRRNAIPTAGTSWPRRHIFAPARMTRPRCFGWEDEGSDLEADILEFMKSSSKPEAFPTRIELIEAGRVDLAEAVVSRGGWMSFGWDSETQEEDEEEEASQIGNYGDAKLHDREASSILSLYPYDTNETKEEEGGIEGILSRLERQRNDSFGFEEEERNDSLSRYAKFPTDDTLISRSSSNEYFSSNVSSQTSRSWRDQTNTKEKNQQLEIEPLEVSEGKELEKESFIDEPRDRNNLESDHEDITSNQLRRRLQNLELELSSVLNSVRSNGDQIVSNNEEGEGLSDRQEIDDAWEFQENAIMKAQEKLRSTRAKLAVLEGKMTLAIIEAQRITEEKQKRIDNAQRALRLLCSTCIVWPNPASEVLLAGSFDGWGNLRKMEKTSSGLFSLCLQLYPGKYEIKFVVNGEWRVDPERPTIDNNGHLNNLIIVL